MAYGLLKSHIPYSLCERNTALTVFASQYTGRSYRRYSQLPPSLLKSVCDAAVDGTVPEIIVHLCNFGANPLYQTTKCLRLLRVVLDTLSNFEPQGATAAVNSFNSQQNAYAKCFMDHGGLEVLARIICAPGVKVPEAYRDGVLPRRVQRLLEIKGHSLDILGRIIISTNGEAAVARLADNEELVVCTFQLLMYQATALLACQFLEDILQHRGKMLDLQTIPDLHKLIRHLDGENLSNFCRILAITISDLDMYENKCSLYEQNRQKRKRGFVNIRDTNQDLLLSIPELLPRLVHLVTDIHYTPRFPDLQSELDCWMRWIDNAMSEAAFNPEQLRDHVPYISGISATTSNGGPMQMHHGLSIANDLIMRVHVVYVLGLFLIGKHRKKVQRRFAELMLVPGLSNLFDHFMWKCQGGTSRTTRHRLRGHTDSCECSPEVAIKIQFLRLVHSFCDHSDYKHLLLTELELDEMKDINEKIGLSTSPDLLRVNTMLMCQGEKGLLSKVVAILKNEPVVSTFRFWLARAVESYLRGSTSYAAQIFLLRRGLLHHVTSNIIGTDSRLKEILQSSFDLLGELVKFNFDAFLEFESVLDTPEKFEKFISIVNSNLVDSNMFLRSLVLSIEHFFNHQSSTYHHNVRLSRAEVLQRSRLLNYVATLETQLSYMRRLISIINVKSLTQENVSCLNTTLVYLMFARRSNELPLYLRSLMMLEGSDTTSSCESAGATVLKNLRDLLLFWQEHYIHKDKDCSALEKSSRINFDYWKQTVMTMISDNRNDVNSIIHYINPEMLLRDN